MPDLEVPALIGTLDLDVPRDSLHMTLAHRTPIGVSIASDMIQLSSCNLTVAATVNVSSLGSVPPLEATMECLALIGGGDGFSARVSDH